MGLTSPGLAARPHLAGRQPQPRSCRAAPEEVVVTVALVAGPGQSPPSVHPQLEPGTVLAAGPGTDHPQVPVLPAGDQLQLARIPAAQDVKVETFNILNRGLG